MHDDEKFEEFLRHEASGYRAEVPPPAEAIWAKIEGDVRDAINPVRRMTPPWVIAVTAIAATLLIGVAVGRWTKTETASKTPVMASQPAAPGSDSAYRNAIAISHLEQAEVFLTSVRADIRANRHDANRAERSRELLMRTRLLLGSGKQPAAVQQLLQDLELLLVEIAATPATHNSMDKQLLDESLRQGNILPRIRATLPAPIGA